MSVNVRLISTHLAVSISHAILIVLQVVTACLNIEIDIVGHDMIYTYIHTLVLGAYT